MKLPRTTIKQLLQCFLFAITTLTSLYSCNRSSANIEAHSAPVSLPVIEIKMLPATTSRDYSSTLEGKVNVEIRPQVDGYIEKIFVDEGAYVKAGQQLFKINDRVYRERLNNARSVVLAARAVLKRAQVEVDKLI